MKPQNLAEYEHQRQNLNWARQRSSRVQALISWTVKSMVKPAKTVTFTAQDLPDPSPLQH